MRLKSLLIGGFLALAASYGWSAGGLTTRAGINKPSIGDAGWGSTLQTTYDVIDSSFALLAATQTWTASQTYGQITASTVTASSATFTNASITSLAGSTVTYSSATFSLANITGLVGSTVTYSSATFTRANISTLTVSNIVGTTTNDSAAVGNFGQFASSLTTSGAAISGTNSTWADFGSIILTAGDWDISLMCLFSRNGATYNGVQNCGIGTAAGNSATGIIDGDNQAYGQIDNTSTLYTVTVPPWRASISGSTTFFGKIFTQTSAGTAKAYGRISARRIR